MSLVHRHIINGSKVRAARKRRNLSQEEVAEAVGWSKSYQSKIECGLVRTVSAEAGERLFAVIGYP